MTTTTGTIDLGDGYVETDMPPAGHDPASWVWDRAITLFHVTADKRVADPVGFGASLIGQHGRLTATTGEPRDLNRLDYDIRRGAPFHRAGVNLVLGTGTVRLRSRHYATTYNQCDTWNGAPENHHGYTAFGLDTGLNELHMRSLWGQWVQLHFTPTTH